MNDGHLMTVVTDKVTIILACREGRIVLTWPPSQAAVRTSLRSTAAAAAAASPPVCAFIYDCSSPIDKWPESASRAENGALPLTLVTLLTCDLRQMGVSGVLDLGTGCERCQLLLNRANC